MRRIMGRGCQVVACFTHDKVITLEGGRPRRVVRRTPLFKEDHLHACPGAICVRPMVGTYVVCRGLGAQAPFPDSGPGMVRFWMGRGLGTVQVT